MMDKYGGQWHVVKIGDGYVEVHKEYLKTHKVKSVHKVKDVYAVKDVWYKRMLIPFIKALTKLLRWLTVKRK